MCFCPYSSPGLSKPLSQILASHSPAIPRVWGDEAPSQHHTYAPLTDWGTRSTFLASYNTPLPAENMEQSVLRSNFRPMAHMAVYADSVPRTEHSPLFEKTKKQSQDLCNLLLGHTFSVLYRDIFPHLLSPRSLNRVKTP